MTERDTHFAGAARLLIDEVYAHGPQTIDVYEQIITHFLYDFLDHASQYVLVRPEDVPDMTEWSEPH